ncbi:alpha/beta fold hydrolase [Microlunatus sp. Gsoil 973]|uniref:alpha/beta fold hydrolase n=1 Tax=Microlunatus sp. Gsoil 973 TaxID=2672569 RepID=UPI0012B469CD|nr:alpha/beta hydrolase [Microlunatus sp. Gsoil 973]QGN35117.1 alpha/beta fold hydrolase [Microlunatus sp. Gsoil 973]
MSRREGFGLAAGVAALALGGVAAGFTLERELIGKRLRPAIHGADAEQFFALRTEGQQVETLDGVKLHVEVDEPEPDLVDRPEVTLVFIHGYALSLDCWHFQRRALQGKYRMIFYDHRSHGRSGRSASNLCRISQLAADLAQVLQEVAGPGPVILIGHSMGGMTIMELARQRPEWFGATGPIDGVGPISGVGLVCTSSDDLLDPHPVRGLPARLLARAAMPAMAALNRIPTVVEHTRQAGSDLAWLLTGLMTFPSPVPPAYVKFVGEMLSQTPLEVIADFYPAFAELDESPALQVINTVPTTVIGAKQDLVTPFRHTELLIEELPNADTLILDPCGHMAMIEYHRRVTDELDRLVVRATGGQRGKVTPVRSVGSE